MRLSDEQTEFRDLLSRFFQENVTPEYRRARLSSQRESDPALKQELESLGIFQGFMETPPLFSVQELGILAHEVGYFLVPDALIEQILATAIIPRLLPEPERAALSSLAPSTARGTIAYPQCCDLVLNGDSKTVSGSITWLLGGHDSQWVLAFTRGDKNVQRLVAFSLTATGVVAKRSPALDLTTTLTAVELKDAPVIVLSEEISSTAEDLIESLKAREVAGICRRVVEMSVEYAKTRQQFGVAIGAFQAVQHKLADCYARTEALDSLSSFAVWSAKNSPSQLHLTSRAAIFKASEFGPLVCETCIQVHGGIGFTWEYDLHLYLRRAKTIEAAFCMTESRAQGLLSAVALT
jgi:alkylation response protein AidB-like acyl-CoA dehydrogenase